MIYELQAFSVNYAKQNPEAGELYQSLKKIEQYVSDGTLSKS